jgi:hypothetical protein
MQSVSDGIGLHFIIAILILSPGIFCRESEASSTGVSYSKSKQQVQMFFCIVSKMEVPNVFYTESVAIGIEAFHLYRW